MRFIILILSFATTAAAGNGLEKQRQDSFFAWLKLPVKFQQQYTYRHYQSSYTGYRSETLIAVKEGRVVSRTFFESPIIFEESGRDYLDELVKVWHEDEGDLGTHAQGGPVKTMEELYRDCKDILAFDPKENHLTFTTDNNKILTQCTRFPKDCQDDCSLGVTIKDLTFPHKSDD